MWRRVGFLLFAAGWGTNHFATMLVVYKKELGLAPSALGALYGLYALGLVPGLLLAGRASDVRGRRALVLPMSVLAAATSLLLALGSLNVLFLYLGRFLYGIAMGSMMSPGSVWLQELSGAGVGPRRATLFLSAGFGFGPLFTGLLVEVAPWTMVLPYVVHVVVILSALALARPVPETAAGAKGTHMKTAMPEPNDPHATRTAVRLLFGQLPVAPWAFAYPALSGAVMPNLMRAYVERPALYAGFVLVAMLMFGVAVQPLTARFGRHGDLLGLVLGAIGIEIAAYAVKVHSPNLVYVAGFFLGAAYGFVITIGLRNISERVSSRHRGTAVGVYYVLTYIGFSVPFIYALLAKSYGDLPTMHGLAIAGVSCVPIRALVTRFEPK